VSLAFAGATPPRLRFTTVLFFANRGNDQSSQKKQHDRVLTPSGLLSTLLISNVLSASRPEPSTDWSARHDFAFSFLFLRSFLCSGPAEIDSCRLRGGKCKTCSGPSSDLKICMNSFFGLLSSAINPSPDLRPAALVRSPGPAGRVSHPKLPASRASCRHTNRDRPTNQQRVCRMPDTPSCLPLSLLRECTPIGRGGKMDGTGGGEPVPGLTRSRRLKTVLFWGLCSPTSLHSARLFYFC